MIENWSEEMAEKTRTLAAAATPGPCTAAIYGPSDLSEVWGFGPFGSTRVGAFPRGNDAEFYAHARTALPAAMARIEELEREMGTLRGDLMERTTERDLAERIEGDLRTSVEALTTRLTESERDVQFLRDQCRTDARSFATALATVEYEKATLEQENASLVHRLRESDNAFAVQELRAVAAESEARRLDRENADWRRSAAGTEEGGDENAADDDVPPGYFERVEQKLAAAPVVADDGIDIVEVDEP